MVEQCYQNMQYVIVKFIKNQEAKGLLSDLGVGTPLSKVSISVDILFRIVRIK